MHAQNPISGHDVVVGFLHEVLFMEYTPHGIFASLSRGNQYFSLVHGIARNQSMPPLDLSCICHFRPAVLSNMTVHCRNFQCGETFNGPMIMLTLHRPL